MSAVTVAITTTGRPHFLRTALQSVAGQVDSHLISEIIVSENSGDRRTEDVVGEFASLPVRFVFRQPTLPMAEHLFAVYRSVRTPLIAVLNDDDWWTAGHIACAVDRLKATGAVAYGAASLFTSDEAQQNPRWIDRSPAMCVLNKPPSWVTTWSIEPETMLALCWVYTPFHVSSLVARTDALKCVIDRIELVGHNSYTIDRLILAGLSHQGGTIVYSPLPDTFVRWHDGNLVNNTKASEARRLLAETRHAIERLALQRQLDLPSIWRVALTESSGSSDAVVATVLARFREGFTDVELHELGLFALLQRPGNNRSRLHQLAKYASKLVGI